MPKFMSLHFAEGNISDKTVVTVVAWKVYIRAISTSMAEQFTCCLKTQDGGVHAMRLNQKHVNYGGMQVCITYITFVSVKSLTVANDSLPLI